MAKSNDIADKVLNIGIVVAVIAGLWFLFKYLRSISSHFGKGGFGGPAAEGDLLGKTKNVGDKISDAYHDAITKPTKALRIGVELSIANKSASIYWKKAGSNPIINKILKAVNALPDNEFLEAVNEWQKIDHWTDFYSTTLVGALIYTNAHSVFITRYGTITGNKAFLHAGLTTIGAVAGVNLTGRNHGNN